MLEQESLERVDPANQGPRTIPPEIRAGLTSLCFVAPTAVKFSAAADEAAIDGVKVRAQTSPFAPATQRERRPTACYGSIAQLAVTTRLPQASAIRAIEADRSTMNLFETIRTPPGRCSCCGASSIDGGGSQGAGRMAHLSWVQ
jgi:hypothetical protein